MLDRPADRPLLLVSVRNREEARLAVKGGAEIIDVKEPLKGSLGKAPDQTIAEVAQAVRSLDPGIPLSAALGELQDWKSCTTVPHLPNKLAYVKLGLAGCAHDPDWPKTWQEFRARVAETHAHAIGWVAVIYADWETAQAPPPEEILNVAAEMSCAGVLIDTFRKEGRSLLDIMPAKKLGLLAEEVHQTGWPLAVAGSLRKQDLPRLAPLKPEIVAIRSAACGQARRENPLCPAAVQDFREALKTNLPLTAPDS